jgi:hypothetical protein
MVSFTAEIEKTHKSGEKYGWTYILIPVEMAQQINPCVKTGYRVKGKIGNHECKQTVIMPVGEGRFMLALNAKMRKDIKEKVGDEVMVALELDTEEPPFSEDFLEALTYDTAAENFFNTLTKGNKRYFSNWIESAKTFETKSKRIFMSVEACAKGMNFGEMIRFHKKKSTVH